ncbi:MAG: patatin-like phospholipase family protein [Salibacteraceae bacterium]
MKRTLCLSIISAFLFLQNLNPLEAQRVGVVLSGGGASGLAHVGVLKALEENSIPIDYICGTSIGALVGAMYAAGYSPDEIEKMVVSEKFRRMAMGKIDEKYSYYFFQPRTSASWITVKLNSDSNSILTSIPTSFINPAMLDLELMFLLDPASAAAHYNFDSLFVPFRCVASDITEKEVVVFKNGNLHTAVRASMTYPLYLKPIRVDGKLLFDGGLYNNFPSDVMRQEFDPDVIIGSNVSDNEPPPGDDDFIGQLRNMVIGKTNYDLGGDCCVLIEPRVPYGTFEFRHAAECIDSGYVVTSRKMELIKAKVHRRVHRKVVQEKREEFRKSIPEMRVSDFDYQGLNKVQSRYANLLMQNRKGRIHHPEKIRKNYYRLYASDKIERLFPYSRYNEGDSSYVLTLEVKKEKNLLLEFGGNLASRPINTGYVGVGYNSLNNTAMGFYANVYFGKLYNSVLGSARVDVPTRIPMFLEPSICINRWNYYKSRANFFEENNSLFLIQNEQYVQIKGAMAVANKGLLSVSGGLISIRDSYYQTPNFGQDDIADNTLFFGPSTKICLERNSLNKKLYANQGSRFLISARYTQGEETYTPGSTSIESVTTRQQHDWVDLKLSTETFYKHSGILRLGLVFEGVYSNMELFSNLFASRLRSPAFLPIAESKTLFLESFRAYQYAAVGHRIILSPIQNLDLRLEAYVFQPYRFADNVTETIVSNGNSETVTRTIMREDLSKRYTIASANAVYHSPLGPVSASINYYFNVPELSSDNISTKSPITFLFHFGYILFNDRALE